MAKPDAVGLAGSPTVVRGVREDAPVRRCQLLGRGHDLDRARADTREDGFQSHLAFTVTLSSGGCRLDHCPRDALVGGRYPFKAKLINSGTDKANLTGSPDKVASAPSLID